MLSIAVMKFIGAALDPEVVRQMREAGLGSAVCAVSLNWLSEVSAASEARKRRLQALRAAPLLLPWLLGDRDQVRPGHLVGHEDADDADGAAEPEEDPEVDEDDDIRNTQHALNEAAASARSVALSQAVNGGDALYPLLARIRCCYGQQRSRCQGTRFTGRRKACSRRTVREFLRLLRATDSTERCPRR